MEQMLDIADTPGQIQALSGTDFVEMSAFAEKVIEKISVANIANAMTISSRLSYKGEKDGYDPYLFLMLMRKKLVNKYKSTDSNRLLNGYIRTNEVVHQLNRVGIDKKHLFESYLIDLREIMRRTD